MNRCILLHSSSVYGRKPSSLLLMDFSCHWKVTEVVIIDPAITLKSTVPRQHRWHMYTRDKRKLVVGLFDIGTHMKMSKCM